MAGGTEIYQQQGFGKRIGFGKSPALILIDFSNAFADPTQFGGGNIPDAIAGTKELLATARHLDLPIVYTTHVYAADGSEDGIFNLKAGNMPILRRDTFATAIVADLEPRAGERIIEKHYPSGFFLTDLASWLTKRGVDTAIVTGATTSGCVRATVVDAMGHGFRPIVPRDCVGDRAIGPHEANLFDMDQKYADVMSLDEVLAELAKLAPKQAALAS